MEPFATLMSRLDYPMFVMTTFDGQRRAGCLVGFTTHCSFRPARFLACVSDKNFTHRVVAGATTVAVHALRAEQRDVAELFGGETGDEVDKLARCAWSEGPDGVPVLDDCAGWFAGRIVERHPFGDHTGLLVEPFAGAIPDDEPPLLRFAHVADLEPGHEA